MMTYHQRPIRKSVKRITATLLLAVACAASTKAQTSQYSHVNVASSFNGFETLNSNMVLVANNLWQADFTITNRLFWFKFATANFANNWGINSQPHRQLPQMFSLSSGAGDIYVTNHTDNFEYRFIFNDVTRESAVFLINNLRTNLLYNSSFETAGTQSERARYWQTGTPTSHGGFSGSAQRQGISWGIVSPFGSWVGLIAGTWSGSSGGTWWQEAPIEPGISYQASAWFQPEALPNLWSATNQELKLEFYDFSHSALLGTFTRSLAGLPSGNGTTNWSEQNISGVAPVGAAWARLVVNVAGAGPSGTFRIDNASLIATESKRSEDFNDWAGATIDNSYTRSGWSVITGRTVTSYVYSNQTIPLARSGLAASLSNPTTNPNGSYIQSPRFDTGVGTISFHYRHGYQGNPSENPEAPVHLKVQRSFSGSDFVTIANISNVVNTEFRRFDITTAETSRYVRIVHAGGSTNRLLIDDITITPPEGQPRLMTFNTWTNALTAGNHVFGGWRLNTGIVSSALALSGNAGQIIGNSNSVHYLSSPLFSNGYGTISFSYRLGIASAKTAGFALEASTNGSAWTELDRITNITSTSWQEYQRFFIQPTINQLRIRNLAENTTSSEIVTSINEGFNAGAAPPPGWTFEQIGTYETAGSSGVNIPSLRFDVTGASITTPGLVNPTNIRFMTLGQTISTASYLIVEANVSGAWQVITNLIPIANSKRTNNIPVSNSTTQVRLTYVKATGNLAVDDFIMQGIGFANSNAAQTLLVDDVNIGNPMEYRLQNFDTWPTKTSFDFGSKFHQGWTIDGPVKVTTEKAFSGQSAQMTRTAGSDDVPVPDYIVDFEGTGETKTGYGAASIILNGIAWNLTDVLIGTSDPDWKNGARSARFRGYGTSVMSMDTEKAGGVGSISFKYRRYGTDNQTDWQVQYSTNGGASWANAGGSFRPPTNDIVQTFTNTLNIPGPVRVRIKKVAETGVSNLRMNVDDIVLTSYSTSGATEASDSFITSHYMAEGIGPISFYYRHFQNTAPASASIMTALIQTSSNGVNWITTNTLMISNTTYQLYEQYINLPNHHYARITMTNGTGIALIDNLNIQKPQPPAVVTINGWYEPPLPFTNDIVTLFAQVDPQNGANSITVTSYYRIGTSGAYTAIGMTPSAGNIYTATSAIPAQPRGTIVQYYMEAMYGGPGSATTRPIRFPATATNTPAFYGIPRNATGLVWINEVDYVGGIFNWEIFDTEQSQFIELAGYAGSDIGGWRLELVSAATTNIITFGDYRIPTNTLIPNDVNGYGFYVFGQTNLPSPPRDQMLTNISMDVKKPGAIRLYNEVGGLEHAISYGGFVQGTPSAGSQDPDFPGGELFDEPPTNSISLIGTGTLQPNFNWGTREYTPGAANIGQNFATPALISPSTTLITFNYIAGSYSPASQTLVISNTGPTAMSYTIAATPSWIMVSPSTVSNLAGGAIQTHTVSIETAGLTGNRSGSLSISGSAVNSPVAVQIQALETTLGSALVSYSFDEGGTIPALNGGSLGSVANLNFTNGANRTLDAQGASGQLNDFAYIGAVSNNALARSATAVTGLNNRAQFTVTGWMKTPGGGGSHVIIGNRSATNGFELRTDATYTELVLMSSATGAPTAVSSTNTLIPNSDWHFFAVTFDATNLTSEAIQFFGGSKLNSVYLNSSTNRGALGDSGISTNILKVGGNGSTAFVGWLDDIRMYATRLDVMSIEAVRRQGATRLTGSGEAPIIEEGPASQNLVSGQPLTLTVSASGIPAPQYQWRKFGTNLVGQTLSSYSIASPVLADAGSYDVVVFNAYGSVTSLPAILTLEGNIAISTQPSSQLAYMGDTVQFTVVVVSSNTVTYQWTKTGTNIVGATNATLTLFNVNLTSEAGYRVVASDITGSVTSQIATLTIVDVEIDGSGGGIFTRAGVPGIVLSWPSLSSHTYDILWSSNLMNGTHGFIPVFTNLPATPNINFYTDTVYGVQGQGFYRILSKQNP